MDHTVLPTHFPGTLLVPKAAKKMWASTWWRGWRREAEEAREQQDGQAQECRGSVGWPGSSFACQAKQRGHCQSCPGSFPPGNQGRQAPCIGRATGRAGGMCLVLRAFLHCVFLAKWLLFLDPGSC